MTPRIAVAAIVSLLSVAGPAAAQDMARVRALYVAAAYEEALAAMPAGLSAAAGTELEQYRALCLLALGRENDARATIERLVKAHPTFVPPADEVSPRLRTLFTSVRSALLPGLVKQSYTDAKAAYEAKDREAARAGFQRTLELIDSVPEESRGALTDMRLLAAGFHDLVAAPPAPAEPAAPAPPPTSPARPPSGVFVPAVAIRQELPPWTPTDPVSRRTEYVGLLQLQIGAGRTGDARAHAEGEPPGLRCRRLARGQALAVPARHSGRAADRVRARDRDPAAAADPHRQQDGRRVAFGQADNSQLSPCDKSPLAARLCWGAPGSQAKSHLFWRFRTGDGWYGNRLGARRRRRTPFN